MGEVGSDAMWVGGEAVGAVGGGSWDLVDPGTEQVIARVPYGDAADARLALDAAAKAFPTWSARNVYDRATVLERAAELVRDRLDVVARRTAEESGKPLAQGEGRVGPACRTTCGSPRSTRGSSAGAGSPPAPTAAAST
jgi:succinate-semialdehyde dehydrogenase/glutarate-semialdehyde dehydrogenase